MTDTHKPPTDPDQDLEQLRGWLGPVASDGDVEPGAADLAELSQRVHAGIAAEDSRPLAPLRQRPTWQRNLVGFGLLAVAMAVTMLITPRVDLAHYPLARLAAEVGVFLAVFAACLVVATRGTHLPELPRAWAYGLAALAVLVVAGVALLPPPHTHDPHVSRGWGEIISYCGPGGILLALPMIALIRLLDRGSSVGALVAVSAAGVAANTVMQLHCSITDSAHLLLSHAIVGVVLLLGLVVIGAIERRRSL